MTLPHESSSATPELTSQEPGPKAKAGPELKPKPEGYLMPLERSDIGFRKVYGALMQAGTKTTLSLEHVSKIYGAGATEVRAASEAGTPGESGAPRVSAPEPACTRKLSPWPW